MRSHSCRLDRLERRFSGELSGEQQLRMYLNARDGDATAIEKFARLRAEGKIIPFLGNLFDIENRGPCGGNQCENPRCMTHGAKERQ